MPPRGCATWAHPLIEDNSRRGESTALLNFRAAWTPHNYGELLNALDSKRHDVDYFYATRLPGEPLEGIEDFNARVVEPRLFRIGVKKTF